MKKRQINVREKTRIKERDDSNEQRQGREILLICGPEFMSSSSPFNLPPNAICLSIQLV
jgi:hypothetical protein